MLSNRNNPMLSANTNRLNLGTRSFALTANVNNGDQSPRLRHDHSITTMRAGFIVGAKPPVGGYPQPSQPGSPLAAPQLALGCALRGRVEVVAEAPSERSVVRDESVERKGWPRSRAWTRSSGTTGRTRRSLSATGLMWLPSPLDGQATAVAMPQTTLAAQAAARKGAAAGG
jgi:hypothetical protein